MSRGGHFWPSNGQLGVLLPGIVRDMAFTCDSRQAQPRVVVEVAKSGEEGQGRRRGCSDLPYLPWLNFFDIGIPADIDGVFDTFVSGTSLGMNLEGPFGLWTLVLGDS